MRNTDQILLENLYLDIFESYYDSLKPPREQNSKLGYFDAEKLTGTRVWVHTNRTNRDEGRNGMFGVYIPKSSTGGKETRTDSRYGYTNEIRLKNISIDINVPCLKGMEQNNKRDLCLGIVGDVINAEGNNSGYEEFTFTAFSGIYGFVRKSDPEKKIITSMEEVYFNATEDGRYITLGKGIKTDER